MILYSKHIILEDREFDGFLELQGGKIKGLHSAWDGPYRDFGDQVILPGFIDIHIHGWATGSFWFEKTAGAGGEMCRTLPYAGVTSFLATSGADTIPEIKRCIVAADEAYEAGYPGAELLGGGVNGNTTGGMLAVLPDLLVREHPDAVLLMGGTNDIAYGGDLAGARSNMGAMAHLIIAGGGLPLIGIPPGLRRPIRREWAELMPERAAELLAEYQSWLRRFAAAFRLPVLDFDRAFTRWGEEGLFQPDGLHPNAAGHCLMAETAAALIRSL